MAVADDDCIVALSPLVAHVLRALDANAAWYLGSLDSLWLRGATTHPAVSISWAKFAPDLDGGEDDALCAPEESGLGCVLAIETPVVVDDKRLEAGLFFPACAWPHAAPSSNQGARACAWRPPANATGCSWPLLVSACPLRAALQQRPSALYGIEHDLDDLDDLDAVTVLYGNGMLISRGALRYSSRQQWMLCAARVAPQLTDRRRPEGGSDELQSRCLREITRRYPTVLPQQPPFGKLFDHYVAREDGHNLLDRVLAHAADTGVYCPHMRC
jgi:hypothetical protein